MPVLDASPVVSAATLHKRPDDGSRGRRPVLGTVMAAIAADGSERWCRTASKASTCGSALSPEMDFEHGSRTVIGAFAARGNAVAHSIVDGPGRDRTAALIAALRRRSRGGSHDASDFARAGTATGGDVEQLIGGWLNDGALPGFVVPQALFERVADDADGKPRRDPRARPERRAAAGAGAGPPKPGHPAPECAPGILDGTGCLQCVWR